YEKIRNTTPVRRLYQEQLIEAGVITREDAEAMERRENEALQTALETVKTRPPEPDEPYEPRGPWTGFSRVPPEEQPETGVSIERLQQIAERLAEVPPGFEVHKKLVPFLERRRKAVAEDADIDWAFGE